MGVAAASQPQPVHNKDVARAGCSLLAGRPQVTRSLYIFCFDEPRCAPAAVEPIKLGVDRVFILSGRGANAVAARYGRRGLRCGAEFIPPLSALAVIWFIVNGRLWRPAKNKSRLCKIPRGNLTFFSKRLIDDRAKFGFTIVQCVRDVFCFKPQACLTEN